MLAGLWPASRSAAWRRNSLATSTMRAAAESNAWSGLGATPVTWGSESFTASFNPSPRKTTPARYSISTATVSSTSGMRICLSTSQSSAPFSVGMRPALRSVTLPSPSTVQKFSRAATSPFWKSTPSPRAESAPRPISLFQGSYPKSARWAGPLPGVMPGPRGEISPQLPPAASASRLGSRADSSSDWPVCGCGSPPSPSMTTSRILVSLSLTKRSLV